MKINNERLAIYQRLEIDLERLKLYYINRAKCLLEGFDEFNDPFAVEVKKVLNDFIENPFRDLHELLTEIPQQGIDYNSFHINNTWFDIDYVDNDLIDYYLEAENLSAKEQIELLQKYD